jgi:hypothetical protein
LNNLIFIFLFLDNKRSIVRQLSYAAASTSTIVNKSVDEINSLQSNQCINLELENGTSQPFSNGKNIIIIFLTIGIFCYILIQLNYIAFYYVNYVILDFKKQVLRMLTYLVNEIRYLSSGQSEILKQIKNKESDDLFDDESSIFIDLKDCPIPINDVLDLNTFEDKISGDQCFRNKLVIFNLL